ncbi:class I SAM-dependent methyltransferase [Actinosynnema sp. CA-248983]
MVDRLFADAGLAALYDDLCAGREDFGFYLPLVMGADSVLDVGCGTGELLTTARLAGHRGRLCGLDPAGAMLALARRRDDVEWVLGDLSSVSWDGEFELAVMTGHAFQVLLTDDDVLQALRAVRRALVPGGRFVFETRNPLVRGWERWRAERETEVVDASGAVVRVSYEVHSVEGELVTFSATYRSAAWEQDAVSWSTLRFLERDALVRLVARAGLRVVEQYGDWDGSPLHDGSREIITVAAS